MAYTRILVLGLLYFSTTLNAQALLSFEKLQYLVAVLRLRVDATTTLYYESANTKIITTDETAKVIFNTKANFALRNSFSAAIVAVIILEKNLSQRAAINSTNSLLSTLSKILESRRKTDIIFVTENATAELKLWLCKWCWQNGFHNVILTDMKVTQLYTFDPFPKIQLHKTTLKDYLKQRMNWRDFQGYKIRATAGSNPPRALVYRAKSGELRFQGAFPRALSLFAELYNATLELLLMPDFENYTTHECARYLNKGLADICADGLQWGVGFPVTQPQFLIHNYLLVPFAQPVEKFRYFLKPFHTHLWLLICMTIFYISLALTAVKYQQSGGHWWYGYFFLETLSSVLFIAFNLKHLNGRAKVLIIVLLIGFGFIVSNFYLTMLSSILTTNVYEPQINALEDVQKRNLTVMIGDFDRLIFEIYGVSDIIAERILEVEGNEQRKYFYKLDPKYAYPKLSDKCDFYLYQQKFLRRPRMKNLEKPICTLFGGMPMTKNWPLEELLNLHMQRNFEGGFYQFALNQAKEEAIHAGHLTFFKTEYYDVVPLSMEYFEMPAILLAAGYMLGLLSFILERFSKR